MWVTGSAFSNRGLPVRTLDPIKLAKFWDPEGKFIRAYIPELRNMPLQYIFEPWLAPLDVQEMANCRIGADYPKPFLDHKAARAKNLHKIEELNESFNRVCKTSIGIRLVMALGRPQLLKIIVVIVSCVGCNRC